MSEIVAIRPTLYLKNQISGTRYGAEYEMLIDQSLEKGNYRIFSFKNLISVRSINKKKRQGKSFSQFK